MNADIFLEFGRNPQYWFRKSLNLRNSANVLFDAYHSQAMKWARADEADQTLIWGQALAHLDSAKMLYGLALETALKGTIIRERPSSVQFSITSDASGNVLTAELSDISGQKKGGHNLMKLALETHLLDRDSNAVFQNQEDFNIAQDILNDLTSFVTWLSRYPIPVRATQEPQYPKDPRSLGTEFRNWTDRMLDHLHGIPTDA